MVAYNRPHHGTSNYYLGYNWY